jgi:hypothetical protein
MLASVILADTRQDHILFGFENLHNNGHFLGLFAKV